MNNITKALQQKIDLKTKPTGALGRLESLALQIGLVQNTTEPVLKAPHLLLFAADHGITKEGVSAYPQEVTFQMVMNILQGGAAVNVFCRQHQINILTIDAGVNHIFPDNPHLINSKVGMGTHSFLSEKAMTREQLEKCFEKATSIVDQVATTCNVIGFGEMGIGNTSSASMIMHSLCGFPLIECIGRGTGLNDQQLHHKFEILHSAKLFHGELTTPRDILQTYGGFEIAQICGAMLAAFQNNMLILVDGFIATSAFLVAHAMNPNIIKNAIFCHQSNEAGHQKMLQYLNVDPILHLDMRLGEGSGCALAYPIIESSVKFLNEMASFESAGVSNK